MLKLTHTPHKTLAELGIFCVIFALCSQLVVPNVEIAWKFPSPVCITVVMCVYCIDGWEEEWINECLTNFD